MTGPTLPNPTREEELIKRALKAVAGRPDAHLVVGVDSDIIRAGDIRTLAQALQSAMEREKVLGADNARLLGLASQAQSNKNATERLLIADRARIEELEKALAPFAAAAYRREAVSSRALSDQTDARVKLGFLRVARLALSHPDKEGSK